MHRFAGISWEHGTIIQLLTTTKIPNLWFFDLVSTFPFILKYITERAYMYILADHHKTFVESPLDSKQIKPVNPKGNLPFTGRTDA